MKKITIVFLFIFSFTQAQDLTLSGGTLTIERTGSLTMTGNFTNNSATVTLVIDVSKYNQNITIDPPGSEFILFEEDLTYSINAYSDQSFNDLIYEIVSGTNALINGSTLDIFDIGEFKIRVSHPGNNEFNAASQTKIITVLLELIVFKISLLSSSFRTYGKH